MRAARDDLLVGLLIIVAVLQAWSIFVSPHRQARPPAALGDRPPLPVSVDRLAMHPQPPPQPPHARPPSGGPLHLRELLAGVMALETDERLRLSPAQTRRLLPVLRRYRGAYDAIPDGERAVLNALTARQRAWLTKHVPQRPPRVDPRHSAETQTERAATHALRALKSRDTH